MKQKNGLVLPYFLDIFLQEFGRTTYLKKEKLNGWEIYLNADKNKTNTQNISFFHF